MRKQVFGRKFKRNKNQRKALFTGLMSAMVLRGSIETTEEKAKSIKGDVEKLVTKAKKDEAVARRLLQKYLKPLEIDKLITEIAPKFKSRNGGYTRLIKTGNRFSDNASMAILQWVEGEEVAVVKAVKEPVKKEAAKKVEKKETPKSAKKPAKKTVKKESAKAK